MRREKTVIIKDGDKELTFKIRQMSATDAHDFTVKAILLAGGAIKSGAVFDGGVEGLMSLMGGMSFEAVKDLTDSLLACCTRVVDGGEMVCTRSDIDGYIDNVSTIFKLYEMAVEVNFPQFTEGEKTSEKKSDSPVTVHSGRPQKRKE